MHKTIQQWVAELVLGIALSLTLAGHVVAGQFEDGVGAYYQENYQHAFELWLPLAEKGDPMSQVLVGSLFAFGQGVERNDLEAVRWYGQAAFQGNAQGQFNLAIMYEHGWGVRKNLDLAVHWYGKAAIQGRQDARERLATLTIAMADQPEKQLTISASSKDSDSDSDSGAGANTETDTDADTDADADTGDDDDHRVVAAQTVNKADDNTPHKNLAQATASMPTPPETPVTQASAPMPKSEPESESESEKSSGEPEAEPAATPEPVQVARTSPAASLPEHPPVIPKLAEASKSNDQPLEVTMSARPMSHDVLSVNTPPSMTQEQADLFEQDLSEQAQSEHTQLTKGPSSSVQTGPSESAGQDDNPPESKNIFSFFGSMIGNILSLGSTGEDIPFDGDDSFEEELWEEDKQVAATLKQPPADTNNVKQQVSTQPPASKRIEKPQTNHQATINPYPDEYTWQQARPAAEDDVVDESPPKVTEKPAKQPAKDSSSLTFLPTADGWKDTYADDYDWQTNPKIPVESDEVTAHEIPPAPANADETVKKESQPVTNIQIDEDSDLVRLPNGRVMLTIPKKNE